MAESPSSASPPASAPDRDLTSIREARDAVRRARAAQDRLAEFSQPQIDTIVRQMAEAAAAEAESLATLAVDETGYGIRADKIQKNLFAARRVHAFISDMQTVGVVRTVPERGILEIAEPFGVVAAIVPSTNPTSTAIYKILIAVKARCAIVLSPHPAAVTCITKTAELMAKAGAAAGLPDGSIGWTRTVTLEGTQELMQHRDIAVILATGGMGLVRAAYSAGKPAYGVGPGNAPAYIERSADVGKAVRDIVAGKTFDNGVLCSSENSVVVDRAVADEAKQRFRSAGAHFLSRADTDRLADALVTPQRLPNPELVGKSAVAIASKVGLEVPRDTRVLVAELEGVGRKYPLSIEKLCPVLSFYVVDDWRAGCERCKEILRYGGMGHTMSIHSRDDTVVLEFGLRKPASRIVVNTPTAHGSIGLTTGLDPAMTLGCGGFGGNITSDNISPQHLINIKRLAYETRTVESALTGDDHAPTGLSAGPVERPQAIDSATLARRIDAFLATRGLTRPEPTQLRPLPAPLPSTPSPLSVATRRHTEGLTPATPDLPHAAAVVSSPAEFVCEDDVRQAMREARSIVVGEKTIITPAARDLAEQHGVFVYAGL